MRVCMQSFVDVVSLQQKCAKPWKCISRRNTDCRETLLQGSEHVSLSSIIPVLPLNWLICFKYGKFENVTYFTGYHVHSSESRILLLFEVVSTLKKKMNGNFTGHVSILKNYCALLLGHDKYAHFCLKYVIYIIRIWLEIIRPKSLFASNSHWT